MSYPLVSVLTTVYNQAEFLPLCLRSVQAQTYRNFEHIILDDGSTDDSETVVDKYSDKRTVFVRQKHGGLERLSKLYNYGLKMARGDFIAILEADDFYSKYKLELQIGSLREHRVVLSFGKVVDVDENHNFLGVSPNSSKFKNVKDWLAPLLVNDYICALTVMMKKQALLEIGGFIQPEFARGVDYYTFLELALIGDFKFVPYVLGYWVHHGSNISDMNRFEALRINRRYVIEFCRKHDLPVPWKKFVQQDSRDLFHIGRHYLLSGEQVKAAKCFRKALLFGSLETKAKAIYGLVNASLGLNFERIAKSLGRPVERVAIA